MRIKEVIPNSDFTLKIIAQDGRVGIFDLRPYFQYEAFEELKEPREFNRVSNGGYFIEWDCGADLSADTIEARWALIQSKEVDANKTTHQTTGFTSPQVP